MTDHPIAFADFYRDHYPKDHRHPINIILHIAGTIAGLALIAAALTQISLWWIVLFPIVHVVPGLIGHRFFDRDAALGDIRLNRTDFPLWWFLIANHIMTIEVLTGRYRRPA